MRADRLVSALLILQARGKVTAAELAGELEVSLATARRDLGALSVAGIPVYAEPGRGGGWQLLGGSRTDLTGLTAPEARALFLLLGSAPQLPDGAAPALRKLLRALPPSFRDDAEAAAAARVTDRAGWGEPAPQRPQLADALENAVVDRRRLRLDYRRSAGERSVRAVNPWAVVDKGGIWYVLAGTDNGPRTFRVDRIEGLEDSGELFERPADLDVLRLWNGVSAEIEGRRSRVRVTVLLDPGHLPVLRDHFGTHLDELGTEPDGRARVSVAGSVPMDVARKLAGWGSLVEVVDSPEVGRLLARLGRELMDLYSED
ncbi:MULTISPECIES: WYL domain-containing protein [Arthrobacter]|uniref:WYL domain-containing protein n=2 Tax=Arthrobacter TaxID=1663 RepID=A0ABU9KL56_9MICC|nr:WYL domain-containing protein [Arthrobacter sp. YJM1]MDP5226272.1 WYL domain-containing protein [Arthrobacter sp. YJM1]